MSELLSKIENINRDAAGVLRKEDLVTDSAIESLSRDDLLYLFPGADKFQTRRSIYEIIHKPEPVDAVFKELKEFIPRDSLQAFLKNEKVLDYVHMLKEIKAQVDNIQGFLQAHIDNLEELKNAEPQEEPDKDPVSDTSSPIPPDAMELDNGQPGGQSQGAHDPWTVIGSSGTSGPLGPHSGSDGHYSQGAKDISSGSGYSGPSGPVVPHSGPHGHNSQGGRGSNRGPFSAKPQRTQVIYKHVVSGKTFGGDVQLIKKVELQAQDGVQLVHKPGHHKIIVLFCPISSRVGADVDAAMSDVEGDDKDVILVLMHHMREPKHTTNIRTWNDYKQVVLHVHVFYHETNNGLLTCPQNDDAFSSIWTKLLEYETPDTSGNALGVGDERGCTTNRGGNNSSSSGSWLPNKPSWWRR